MSNSIINFIERNIRGAVVIHGALGYRQYYDLNPDHKSRRAKNHIKEVVRIEKADC